MALAAILPQSSALLARLLAGQGAEPAAETLAIELPPLAGGGVGGTAGIDRATLEVLAGLYFEAELERAALIPVAEILAENRFSLQLTDAAAAALLEDFATAQRTRWLARTVREQIFARCFGLGEGSQLAAAPGGNAGFETAFAAVCQALLRVQEELRWSRPSSGSLVRVEYALNALLDNLAQRRFGNTITAARTIQEQLNAAVALLNHPGVRQLFMATSLWDVIRGILGPDTPDLARIVARAQAGLRLIEWAAANLSGLRGAQLQHLLSASADPFVHAAGWLQATGIEAAPEAGMGPRHAVPYHAAGRHALGLSAGPWT